MKHEQALAIRTLTESMHIAYNMNDEGLKNLLRDQIFSMVVPQSPETPFVVQGENVYINEKAVDGPGPEPKSIEELVVEAIGDQCPCCVIRELLISGEPFPYGTEEFLYGFAKTAGPEVTRGTIQAVATNISEIFEKDRSLVTKEFAQRYAEFTLATTRVRVRLAEEGLLAPLTDSQKFIAELMEADLKRRLAAL